MAINLRKVNRVWVWKVILAFGENFYKADDRRKLSPAIKRLTGFQSRKKCIKFYSLGFNWAQGELHWRRGRFVMSFRSLLQKTKFFFLNFLLVLNKKGIMPEHRLKKEELPFFDLKRQPEMWKHHQLHHQPDPQWASVKKWTFFSCLAGVTMFYLSQKFTRIDFFF